MYKPFISFFKLPLSKTLKNELKTRIFSYSPRCLVPLSSGICYYLVEEDIVWDRYYTNAPRRRTPSEQNYSDRRIRSRFCEDFYLSHIRVATKLRKAIKDSAVLSNLEKILLKCFILPKKHSIRWCFL